MPDIPNYPYEAETKETIRNRMLSEVSDEWDKTEGGFVWDAVSPAASEAARLQEKAKDILRRAFVAWASGPYLDAKAAERGIYRREAVRAKGMLRIEGTPGTIIYGGTRFSTEVDASGDKEPIIVTTDTYAVIPASGVIDVPATCTAAGEAGNVQAGLITVNVDRVRGIKSVTNPAPFSFGADAESDDSFRNRYLEAVKVPSSSGNISDYKKWAYEASNLVGRVKVLPTWDGNGTVKVIIADSSLNPATPALAREVLNYLDPPYSVTKGKGDLVPGGDGVVDEGTAWKMTPGVSVGTLTLPLDSILSANPAYSKEGLYCAAVRVMVDNTDGTDDLLRVYVHNETTGQTASTRRDGTGAAEVVVKASDLNLVYGYLYVGFFWNGMDSLTLKIERQTGDTTTTVFVDSVEVYSQFGGMQGGGVVPIGAKVTVTAPDVIAVDVQATLQIDPRYDPEDVKARVAEAIRTYIRSLALSESPNVLYGRVSNAVFNVNGVEDAVDLVIRANGGEWGTSSIQVPPDAMAVPGTITLN